MSQIDIYHLTLLDVYNLNANLKYEKIISARGTFPRGFNFSAKHPFYLSGLYED